MVSNLFICESTTYQFCFPDSTFTVRMTLHTQIANTHYEPI